jgi:hypothetical protein
VESEAARLEEAILAYRGAPKEFTRERVPLRWAVVTSWVCGRSCREKILQEGWLLAAGLAIETSP